MRNKHHPAPVASRDGAQPTATMVLTGIVKTAKGYAVAVAEIAQDGSLRSLMLGPSQANKIFVAKEHQRMLAPMAVKL